MRVADKIFTSLLQRQAAPKETGDKPRADQPKREAQPAPVAQQRGEDRPTDERSLEALSHPAARTLDALIRDRVLSLARDNDAPSSTPQDDQRIEALANSLTQASGAEPSAILSALAEREAALEKAADQNTRLFSQQFRDFLR